ncbi:MAG: 1,6-anhydro-N-acetylmuramyl-L-alanine amidase AmpD, partial [Gammaproteobacteria bacterium]|nr:1,6-anhydro-N-acetylmuramyl-L-alanine amidase AmpD [Gammaproteobacteria bacterium]
MTFACDTTTGLVGGAQFIPSPNFDERPPGTDIDLLVLHGISLPPNEFGNGCVARLFTNCLPWEAHPYFQQIEGMKVSSHLFIT